MLIAVQKMFTNNWLINHSESDEVDKLEYLRVKKEEDKRLTAVTLTVRVEVKRYKSGVEPLLSISFDHPRPLYLDSSPTLKGHH